MNQTAKNEELLRDSVLLPHALTMIEEDARSIAASKDPLRRLYVAAAKVLHVRLTDELEAVQKEIQQRGLRADKIEVDREEARAVISEKLRRNVREIANDLRRR
ncbi:hypothetical protein P4H70_22975 [Paenibacillus ehimensis]|uniref:hypothetical protein n=1 Tax=Paenibacillus ehimensis TaxID=79264 RepID=UPI002DB8E322|nr:hypothetical protein [Paenibacillus ehimensis]MEC0211809.1 hypothetical protein [Paenibacillus ehimensis]